VLCNNSAKQLNAVMVAVTNLQMRIQKYWIQIAVGGEFVESEKHRKKMGF